MAKLSFDLATLTANFVAKGGKVQQVESGKRVMTESQVYRAMGYEPEKLYRFDVHMTGEDGMEWCERLTARNKGDVMAKAQEAWPESRVEWIDQV